MGPAGGYGDGLLLVGGEVAGEVFTPSAGLHACARTDSVCVHTHLVQEESDMTNTAPVRTIDGTEYPAPGRWTIDPGHAEIGFVGRHFGLTRVRGRFTGVTGHADLADDIGDSTLTVVIDTATVSSGDATRDDHLRSADLFDVEQYPRATFTSTAITVDGTTGTVAGNLTIKGVTRPVTLDVDYV